jgi:hypothetical protein
MFGYRQVVELETCLNLSILWLPVIIYYKNLMIYVLNLTQFDFRFKKSFVDVVALFNCQKLATKE